jgi:hypothetical protein
LDILRKGRGEAGSIYLFRKTQTPFHSGSHCLGMRMPIVQIMAFHLLIPNVNAVRVWRINYNYASDPTFSAQLRFGCTVLSNPRIFILQTRSRFAPSTKTKAKANK